MARDEAVLDRHGRLCWLGVLEWVTLSAETIRVVNGPNGEPLLDISCARRGAGGVWRCLPFEAGFIIEREDAGRAQAFRAGVSESGRE